MWEKLVRKWQAAWQTQGIKIPQVTPTPPDKEGDLTLNVFPLLKTWSPQLEKQVLEPLEEVAFYEHVQGYLNLTLKPAFWASFLRSWLNEDGLQTENPVQILVEYASPNTNKPLHLGHLRNIFLGESICRLWERQGHKVWRINLINDRGIHIAKSTIGWLHYGEGKTPQEVGKKGDHFVGDYYVLFEKHYKEQVQALEARGLTPQEAQHQAPLFQEAQTWLRQWEKKDASVRQVWEKLNGWVYEGFEETFRRLGVTFDKVYYESETYQLGKELVQEGLEKNLFYRSSDGAVWADLTHMRMDKKILLRSDGTSVYITQDLGTAELRFKDFPNLNKAIYVIGDEQEYHMKALQALLKMLGRSYADKIYHLSYGMVELPTGKMKTREGTVVDADDLLDALHQEAYNLTDASLPDVQRHDIAEKVGQAAVRFYLLRVEPKKRILFDPQASIDLKGFTGPFIQYTYTRIRSLRDKALYEPDYTQILPIPQLEPVERRLLKKLFYFTQVWKEAAQKFLPSHLAQEVYTLAQAYNELYQNLPILKEVDPTKRNFRLGLSAAVQKALELGAYGLTFSLPQRM
ncbi:MAG: arginine--tRNA ligase [Bacteroidia bacterium]